MKNHSIFPGDKEFRRLRVSGVWLYKLASHAPPWEKRDPAYHKGTRLLGVSPYKININIIFRLDNIRRQ